ncbi:HlyC/CorC family transporter [Denitratisoma sp. agr-D3]
MEDVPLSAQLAFLAFLLIISGFFAMAETAMMACNRYRLRAQAQGGHRGAQKVLGLLAKTDKLLGVILLFNTLINAAIATLAGVITVQLFGEEKWVLGVGTLVVSFFILVFAEITPKVIGAGTPDKLALASAHVLGPILRLSDPVISAINLLVTGMLRLMRLKGSGAHEPKPLSPEELRSVVLESSHGIPERHRDILLNLFELEQVTVDDIMVPRGAMEALDLEADPELTLSQLSTSYHRRLPVYAGDLNNILGILLKRRLLAQAMAGEIPDTEALREHLVEPYFIPAGTGIYAQLQFFQENRQRMGLVVDEYGEILGLVTLEDIIEELIGKFTTSTPGGGSDLAWDENGDAMVEGSRSLREINRDLDLALPTDGPKTLNGLLLEHFEDIPESGVSVRIAGVPMEIVQTQDRAVKFVRIHRPSSLLPSPLSVTISAD